MTEKEIKNQIAGPEVQKNISKENDLNEITVPVKFNGELKNLTVGEASLFAQKGMKFDLIKDLFESLKKIAKNHGKSIPEFLQTMKEWDAESRKKELLEKCSGDEELVDKITKLEEKENETGFDSFKELKEFFPKIKDEESLPEQVVESSRLKGTLLLDEYLRYLFLQKKRQEKSIKSQEEAEKSSVGSQFNRNASISPESEEFIKGLWK